MVQISGLVRTSVMAALAVGAAMSASVERASAQDAVTEFYKGRQMKFIIRSEPGGGFDLYSRLIVRHIVRHIPGNPTMLPQNIPGAGGLIAANYIGELAPRDGSHLTMVSQALPMEQALGLAPNLKANLGSFGWLGNLGDSNMLTYTWHTSPTKTIEDAKRRETVIGGTGSDTVSVWLPFIYNLALGTKIKMIGGYKSSGQLKLAMERGEIEGYGGHPWGALKSSSPDLFANNQISILVQVGMKKEKDLPNVPLLSELATDPEGQAIADFVSRSFAVGRPVGTPPGTPPDRLATLRQAFATMVADPAFLAEARTLGDGSDFTPTDGETIQRMIVDILGSPQAIKDKVKSALPARN